MLTSLLAAFQFLTIFPLPARWQPSLAELGRAVGWFPLVGLVVGALLAGANWLLGFFLPSGLSAVLILALWMLAHGAIHFDGFLDTCDGLFGGKTPDQRLTIMRDHRVGAFAVAGGGLLLLFKYSALTTSADRTLALFLAPILGRWGMALAIVLFPYAREQGLGRVMKDHAHWPQAVLSTAITLLAVGSLGGWSGAVAMVVTLVILSLTAGFIQTRIPGLTGDSYGAICEVIEAAALATFVSI
ncbi:MAG TPA: adenosylcobinamide-GDP ribazoletransferase [Anaerolineae bacterium]|nr:adenosylcobinamide-GDP ribazoletransferase [Anaerolineae bacterium]